MNNNKLLKRSIIMMLSFVMVLTSAVFPAFAASKKTLKMTVYTDVLVKGGYAYCSSIKGLYKVNLKTHAVKRLVKQEAPGICEFTNLKYYKGYLYYEDLTSSIGGCLYRIKLSGKGKKDLGGNMGDYYLKKSKLYYETYKSNPTKPYCLKMKLNGKNKKKVSKYTVSCRQKRSNKKGYSVVWKELSNGKTQYLLKLPSGKKIKLDTYEW